MSDNYIFRFILIDVGQFGCHSDGGVLSNSEFGKALEHNDLGLPESRPLSCSTNPTPFVIVGDAAFPL